MRQSIQSKKAALHAYLEEPHTPLGYAIMGAISAMVIASVAAVIAEIFIPSLYARYAHIFTAAEYVFVGVFTVEYLVRVFTAPKKFAFVTRPLSLVDFFAIAPAYIELLLPVFPVSSLLALRVVRLLRVLRLVRLAKLFRYGGIVKRVCVYKGTILQAIMPVLFFFVLAKLLVWFGEARSVWAVEADLGELFAIIGFSLGIILSQKISVTYQKFTHVEEMSIHIYSALRSLELIINSVLGDTSGTTLAKAWAKTFVELLERPVITSTAGLARECANLNRAIARVEKTPSEVTMLAASLNKDAHVCLSKKNRLTPKAYDTLLHQALLVYFLLIVLFIPGIVGLVSVMVAAYILYGMYNVTQDLDSIIGGEFQLMNINITELKTYALGTEE